ncbi:MAG: hypothetical protein Q4G61_08390 [Tissierellia bacterium]|nr:hypothetical protein [Tissierellia bacterium]
MFIAAIHAFRIKRPVILSVITGIAVVLMRILVEYFMGSFDPVVASGHFLEVAFYMGYAIIYSATVINNNSTYPLPLVAALTLSDAGGNVIEFMLRSIAHDQAWDQTPLIAILLAAAVRAVIIVILVWILDQYVTPKFNIERSRHD